MSNNNVTALQTQQTPPTQQAPAPQPAPQSVEVVTVPANVLIAALRVTPTADVRDYLNGVCINADHVVATDGHRLIAFDHYQTLEANEANSLARYARDGIIIPVEDIKRLKAACGTPTQQRNTNVTIMATRPTPTAGPAWHFQTDQGATLPFTPIDGKYPDYTRLIPEEDNLSGSTGYPANTSFNFPYLYSFWQLGKDLGICASDKHPVLTPNGNGAALISYPGRTDITGVILPLKIR